MKKKILLIVLMALAVCMASLTMTACGGTQAQSIEVSGPSSVVLGEFNYNEYTIMAMRKDGTVDYVQLKPEHLLKGYDRVVNTTGRHEVKIAYGGCFATFEIDVSMPALLADYQYNNFAVLDNVAYGIDEESATVLREVGAVGDLVIPEVVYHDWKAYPVTKIGESAFAHLASPTSVKLPESVRQIEKLAFSGCKSLTRVEIPTTVKIMGAKVFDACAALTIYCDAPSIPMAWDSAWNDNTALSNKIPVVWDYENNEVAEDGYVYVEKDDVRYALKDGIASVVRQTAKLTTAKIQPSITHNEQEYPVTTIVSRAFQNCIWITSVEVPSSVTTVEDYAFSGENEHGEQGCLIVYCEAATKPEGWHNHWKFEYCNVVWDCKNNDVAEDGYIYTMVDGVRYALKDGKASIAIQQSKMEDPELRTKVTYKKKNYDVEAISNRAFYMCKEMTMIDIPKSIKKIGDEAFYGCENLSLIRIPEGVLNIGAKAFSNCSALKKIELPESTMTIGEAAFERCTGIVEIRIPSKVRVLEKGLFQNCTALESIDLPDGLNDIGEQVFLNCITLFDVEIPSTVTKIKYQAFYNTNLMRIVIPEAVYLMGGVVFSASRYLVIYCEEVRILPDWDPSWASTHTVYWYSANTPTASQTGNYWRYVDGVPTPWATAQ